MINEKNIHKIDFKGNLNNNIWNENKLNPEVRKNLIKIAKDFVDGIELPLKIKDILFTGSLANYNWTNSSDIDLYIIVNVNSDEDFLNDFFHIKSDNFNKKHNIKIFGFPLELNIKKENEEEYKDKSIYSIVKDKWIKIPSKEKPEIDYNKIENKTNKISKEIDDLGQIKDSENRLEKANNIYKKIKELRKCGLEQGGEFSTENIVFKNLRNLKYIDKLKNIILNSYDDLVSLNESSKSKSQQRFFGLVRAVQKGDIKPSEVSQNIVKAAKKISHKDVIDFVSIKTDKLPEKIEETQKKTRYEYGCAMLYLNFNNWDDILNIIEKDDIYNLPDYGLEKEPHLTLLYGFDGDVEPEDVKKILDIKMKSPITISIYDISIFENENFDVVKFSIKSDELDKIHNSLKLLPNKQSYPNYTPHITIAYVKKGTGKKYIGKLKEKINTQSSHIVMSVINGNKYEWVSGTNKDNILGFENNIENLTDKKINIIKDFINFTINKLQIINPVKVYLHKQKDEYIGTTAAYHPDSDENHIRVGGRALVDVLRSIGHEMTHNKQRENKIFNPKDKVQNIGGTIEDQANAVAGILIKDFTHNYGFGYIYDL